MPKSEKFQDLLLNRHSYSFQKMEGLPVLCLTDAIIQEVLTVGDKITLFKLADGKYFVSKADSEDLTAFTVGKLTLSHIYFADEITVEEK